MDATAHGLVHEMGRLFVGVGDEADVTRRMVGLHEEASGFQKDRYG